MRERRRSDRLVAIGLLGALLLMPPLLSVAEADGRVLGLPVLHVYLFGVWALIIVLLAVVAERS